MATKKLSQTMVDAIALAKSGDGTLVRYPGGYWSKVGYSNKDFEVTGHKIPHAGTQTVRALVERGVAVDITDRVQYDYMTKVKIVSPEGAE